MNSSNLFNILLVGDCTVGKSTFIERHHSGEFTKAYNHTEQPRSTNLPFCTTVGDVILNVIECNTVADVCNLDPHVVIHGVIIMFDVTQKSTYESVRKWYKCSACLVGDTRNIVLCGNKCDNKLVQVSDKHVLFHRKLNIKYFKVSARSNYNFERPFLQLIQNIYDDDVKFTEAPALFPPEITDFPALTFEYEKMMLAANDKVENL